MSSLAVTCPAAIAADQHKQKTAGWWADPEYQAIETEFLRKNPICEYCGKPATVAHHDDERAYWSKEEYYNLDANGTPACGKCHWMYRRGYEICPVCKAHYMRRGAEKCQHCRGIKIHARRKHHTSRKRRNLHPCRFRQTFQRCRLTGICTHSWKRALDCGSFEERIKEGSI
jgi:hypothetical protein